VTIATANVIRIVLLRRNKELDRLHGSDSNVEDQADNGDLFPDGGAGKNADGTLRQPRDARADYRYLV
jgi:hypothetical protein